MKENSLRVYQTGRKERVFYCLFFLGQNILWGYAGFMETFLTDIGIAAATAAAILLVPKLWDAFNDVLFGYLVDRHKFKNGQKFVPWIRIGTAALSITTVAMFAVPEGLAQPQKIAWFMVSYVLFDISYTIQDTPVFALTTVMISDVEERSAIIAGGKLWSMVGGVIATLLVPMVRPHLGWLGACIVFVAVSIGMMIPLLFGAKERTSAEAEENPGLREMLSYLKGNKYLIVALLALLILGLANLE